MTTTQYAIILLYLYILYFVPLFIEFLKMCTNTQKISKLHNKFSKHEQVNPYSLPAHKGRDYSLIIIIFYYS